MKTRLPTHLTINQLVAHRLAVARGEKGWTQEQAAERLERYLGQRWSKATFSAAERSVDGRRPREFSVNEVVAFAAAFGHSIDWFFVPPEEDLHFHLDAVVISERQDEPGLFDRAGLISADALRRLVVETYDVNPSLSMEVADHLRELADRLETEVMLADAPSGTGDARPPQPEERPRGT